MGVIEAIPGASEGVSAEADLLVPNRPDVIDEVFDGEAVLVNLRSGCYYALNRSASEIWALLSPSGRSVEEVVREVSSRHVLEAVAAAAVERFVEQLRSEELVVVRRGIAPQAPSNLAVAATASGFVTPEITRFDDMQDLLLLDPIHDLDLDGDGWPVPRGERSPE